MPKLIFTGDLVPNFTNKIPVFSSEFLQFVNSCDFHITNLEAPLTNRGTRILKTGPHLRVDPQNRIFLEKANVSIACLANNHIYDFGIEGVRDTIRICNEMKIECIGSLFKEDNKNNKYVIKDFEGIKVLILNYCELEFSVRKSPAEGGSLPYDIVDVLYDVNAFKGLVNYIIIVYHGGNEYNRYPSPQLQKEFRFLLDSGVDAIIAHHTHVISGIEEYHGKPIFYSLGNFCFPFLGEPDIWNIGLIAILEINEKVQFSYRIVQYDPDKCFLSLLSDEEENRVDLEIKQISQIIADAEDLKNVREKYLMEKSSEVLISLLELGIFKRLLLKLGFANRIIGIQKGRLLKLFNLIRNKSHRDLIIECLEKLIK